MHAVTLTFCHIRCDETASVCVVVQLTFTATFFFHFDPFLLHFGAWIKPTPGPSTSNKRPASGSRRLMPALAWSFLPPQCLLPCTLVVLSSQSLALTLLSLPPSSFLTVSLLPWTQDSGLQGTTATLFNTEPSPHSPSFLLLLQSIFSTVKFFWGSQRKGTGG